MNSKIDVKRTWFTDVSTIGILKFDDLTLFTLEDTVRTNQPKVPGKTAIPAGEYEIVISYSNRFGKMLPLLLNVPGFQGIRIHAGNNAEATNGCILVGKTRGENWIGESRIAFADLFMKIQKCMKQGKVRISVL